MKEFWLDVKEDPKYEVSNLGNVRKKETGKLMRKNLNREGGYQRVSINGKHRYVHRLVADAFYDGDHSDMDVNHIDGNKQNNHISNLEWCSKKYNIQHASENGLRYSSFRKITPCKYCKHRYDFDICTDKDDDFFCSFGEH